VLIPLPPWFRGSSIPSSLNPDQGATKETQSPGIHGDRGITTILHRSRTLSLAHHPTIPVLLAAVAFAESGRSRGKSGQLTVKGPSIFACAALAHTTFPGTRYPANDQDLSLDVATKRLFCQLSLSCLFFLSSPPRPRIAVFLPS
jgi:hypothetical protein